MTIEQELIRNPTDWPILADWLEDHDQPQRALLFRTPRITNHIGMEFALVPADTFRMGGGGGKPGDKQVEIAKDFYLGVYPVTQEQWQTIMGTNPSYFSRIGNGEDRVKSISDADLKQFPVETVSWKDVQEFIQRLNTQESSSEWVYRLPTEAEWEFACRGGLSSPQDCSFDFYFDQPTNNLSSTRANFNGNYPVGSAAKGPFLQRPAKVGSYKPNRLGIYDMHGNVWEWCQDILPEDLQYMIRGGSWLSHGEFCTAAYRSWFGPAECRRHVGFRFLAVPKV